MNSTTPTAFSGGDVDIFLEKITADREHELQTITTELKRKVGRIRREAYAESRHFFRQQASRAREQQQYIHERHISRARTAVRRRRWQLLQQLQARIMVSVQERLEKAWQDPQAQQTWCEYWLRAAIVHAEGAPLSISLGAGNLSTTQTLIETLVAKYPTPPAISRPENQMPGIVIEWDGARLDGSLASQLAQTEDTVFTALNALLHDDQTELRETHGHG